MKMVSSICFVLSEISAKPIPYDRQRVLAWNIGPPTPFWWPKGVNGSAGSMKVFESARFCNINNTYWPPFPTSHELVPYSVNTSYFRIRDMATGTIVSNIQGSEGYAYGSAVVDPETRRVNFVIMCLYWCPPCVARLLLLLRVCLRRHHNCRRCRRRLCRFRLPLLPLPPLLRVCGHPTLAYS